MPLLTLSKYRVEPIRCWLGESPVEPRLAPCHYIGIKFFHQFVNLIFFSAFFLSPMYKTTKARIFLNIIRVVLSDLTFSSCPYFPTVNKSDITDHTPRCAICSALARSQNKRMLSACVRKWVKLVCVQFVRSIKLQTDEEILSRNWYAACSNRQGGSMAQEHCWERSNHLHCLAPCSCWCPHTSCCYCAAVTTLGLWNASK